MIELLKLVWFGFLFPYTKGSWKLQRNLEKVANHITSENQNEQGEVLSSHGDFIVLSDLQNDYNNQLDDPFLIDDYDDGVDW